MDTKKVLKQLFLERNIDYTQIAEKLNIQPQSLRNKINRGTYSLNDFAELLDILDCDLQVVTRDSKKIFQ